MIEKIRYIGYRILSKLVTLLMERSLEKPTKHEIVLIEELKYHLRELSPLAKETSEAKNNWIANINELFQLLNNKDPREFIRWDVIRRTMFVGNVPYVIKELNYLRKNNWDLWKNAIKESKVGCPTPFLLYPSSSGILIHHAYHLARFENQTGEKISDVHYVFEFGGGYGSMCRLIHNMGCNGNYVIFDFPVFSALQVFFLKMLGLNAELDINTHIGGISCISEISQLEKIISKMLNKKIIFIATWSISEAPVETRDSILKLVKSFDLFLIAYQKSFGEVDNNLFFSDWIKCMNNIEWYNCEITHLPNNYYLFGKRK